MLRVLPEEGLEGGQRLVHLQRAVGADVQGRVVGQSRLGRERELAGDHLPVDRIGDRDRIVGAHEAEIADVFDVVGRDRLGGRRAAQQRLHHPADPLLLQLVRELVEMRLPAADQLLACVLDGGGGDRPASVPASLVVEAGLVRQRVHQPRLAARELPDSAPRLRRERLAGLRGVLRQERVDLGRREVPQPQRLGADVERAAAGDNRVLAVGPDAVVAHIAHAAQDDALRESARTLRVAGAAVAAAPRAACPR